MAMPRAPNFAGERVGVMARDSTGCLAATTGRAGSVVGRGGMTGLAVTSDDTIVTVAETPDHARRTFITSHSTECTRDAMGATRGGDNRRTRASATCGILR